MTTDTAREQYSRTRLLLGQQGIDRLRAARVAVFGVGRRGRAMWWKPWPAAAWARWT